MQRCQPFPCKSQVHAKTSKGKKKKGKLQVLGFLQIPCKLNLDKLRHTPCKTQARQAKTYSKTYSMQTQARQAKTYSMQTQVRQAKT